MAATKTQTQTQLQADKWLRMAREKARENMGSSAHLISTQVKKALVCMELVAILSHQDEEFIDGDTMHYACDKLTKTDW